MLAQSVKTHAKRKLFVWKKSIGNKHTSIKSLVKTSKQNYRTQNKLIQIRLTQPNIVVREETKPSTNNGRIALQSTASKRSDRWECELRSISFRINAINYTQFVRSVQFINCHLLLRNRFMTGAEWDGVYWMATFNSAATCQW